LTQPAQGDTSLVGTAVLTGINASQIRASLVTFVAKIAGATTGSATLASGTYTTAVAALAASTTVSAAVLFNSNQIGVDSVIYTVTPAAVKLVTASGIVGDNAINASAGAVTNRLNGAFAVQATVLNGTTTTASGVAGAAVSASVSGTLTFTATSSVTINGKTFTSSAALTANGPFALVSDASGNSVVAVSSNNLAAANNLVFVFSSQNQATATVTATQTATRYTATTVGTGFQTVALGGAFTVNYTVADQFKVAAPAGHRLVVAYNGTTQFVAVSAGAASATFTATNSAAAISATNDDLEKQNTTTSNWESVTTAVTGSAVLVKTTAVAASFTTAPTHSATAVVSRASASPKSGYLNELSITGKANHAGQAVTVTAAGVDFSEVATTVAATKNSFTTNADGNGFWTVSAFVHVSGKTTFNYSAGAATASTVVDVAAPFGNEGTTLNIVVVTGDYAAPGSTLRAKVTLADEFGNPVAANDAATESFVISISGPGFMSALPTRFLATGETSEFSILLGGADAGTVTLTATYDADGTGTAKAAVTVTKAVTVGVAPVVETQKVNVGSFKGFVALYAKGYEGQRMSAIVAGKWIQVASLKSGFERVVRFTGAGYDITVKIYIDGKQVGSDFMVLTK
jgi:hypothetical protein